MLDVTGLRYYNNEDKWYRYKGVTPPERTPHGVSEDNIEEIIRKNGEHTCVWKQKGPIIFCNEGENEHGIKIGVYKRLTGTKDGKPVLIDI